MTLSPEYESMVLNKFADLQERGLVYRGEQLVHWSMKD